MRKISLALLTVFLILAVWQISRRHSAPKPATEPKLKAGVAAGIDTNSRRDDIFELLQQQGGMGPADHGLDSVRIYQDAQDQLKDMFQEDPQGVLKEFGDILDLEPGDAEVEKYMAIHTLSKLPLAQTSGLLKNEIEKDLPEASGEHNADDGVVDAVARKLASVRALAGFDSEYLLDLIESPDTLPGVKREAVVAYIQTDPDKPAAINEVKGLLSQKEQYMLKSFQAGVSADQVKNYFLEADAPATSTATATATVKKKVK